uniref:Uncharacterized protein n=1 Tax=Desulfovibrio sp. U5L TaxID=596152 RepID=I2Q582_9BACT
MKVIVPRSCQELDVDTHPTLFLPLEFQSDIVKAFSTNTCRIMEFRRIDKKPPKPPNQDPPRLLALGFTKDPQAGSHAITPFLTNYDCTKGSILWIALRLGGSAIEAESTYRLVVRLGFVDIGTIDYVIDIQFIDGANPIASQVRREKYNSLSFCSFYANIIFLLILFGILSVLLYYKSDIYNSTKFSSYFEWVQTFLLTYFLTRLSEKLVQAQNPLELFIYPEFYLDNGLLKALRYPVTPVILLTFCLISATFFLPRYLPLHMEPLASDFAYYDVSNHREITNGQIYRGYIDNVRIIFKNSSNINENSYVGKVIPTSDSAYVLTYNILSSDAPTLRPQYYTYSINEDDWHKVTLQIDNLNNYKANTYVKLIVDYIKSGTLDANRYLIQIQADAPASSSKIPQAPYSTKGVTTYICNIDRLKYLTANEMATIFDALAESYAASDKKIRFQEAPEFPADLVITQRGMESSFEQLKQDILKSFARSEKKYSGQPFEYVLDMLEHQLDTGDICNNLLTTNAIAAVLQDKRIAFTQQAFPRISRMFQDYFYTYYAKAEYDSDNYRINVAPQRIWRLWIRLLLTVAVGNPDNEKILGKTKEVIQMIQGKCLDNPTHKLIYLEELARQNAITDETNRFFIDCYSKNLCKIKGSIPDFLADCANRFQLQADRLGKLRQRFLEVAGKPDIVPETSCP